MILMMASFTGAHLVSLFDCVTDWLTESGCVCASLVDNNKNNAITSGNHHRRLNANANLPARRQKEAADRHEQVTFR